MRGAHRPSIQLSKPLILTCKKSSAVAPTSPETFTKTGRSPLLLSAAPTAPYLYASTANCCALSKLSSPSYPIILATRLWSTNFWLLALSLSRNSGMALRSSSSLIGPGAKSAGDRTYRSRSSGF